MSYEKTTIMTALRRIRERELVLPGIQRDFVWQAERIYKLLDSILRGYPFGTLLFWNTKQRLQYREFCQDWDGDQPYAFQIKEEGKPGTVVLDGQQRLQSLYLSVYGTYEGQIFYFDLLSGAEQEDLSEPKYHFGFLQAGSVEALNRQYRGEQLWVPLRDLAGIPGAAQLALKAQHYLSQAAVEAGSEAGQRLSYNVNNVFLKLRAEELLNYYVVDKDFEEYGVQTSLDEILEIFVRINSGGQVLSKSDLMFSLMQLHWEDAATSIDALCDDLNARGRFEFDKDFVLKCALVCCGKGARYDVEKLRDSKTVGQLREVFPQLSSALLASADWVVNTAKFRDGRVLGSYNALIPFVYFFYLQPGQKTKGEELPLAMSQALYLALMTRAFSRYADSRIDALVLKVLGPAHQSQPGEFPLVEIRRFILENEGHAGIDDRLLQTNIPLLMNILEGGSLLPEGKRSHRPEYDHIFPKAKLRALEVPEDKINHYANFRLISKKNNIWKSAQDPRPYFLAQPSVMPLYLIPPEHLDYDHFLQFLEKRRELIWERVRTFLGMRPGDEVLPEPPATAQPSSAPTQVASASPVDEREVIRRVLARIPVPNGPRAVFQAIWDAGEKGLSFADLATVTHRTKREMLGVLGALGKRVNRTQGAAALRSRPIGIVLFFDIWKQQGEWWYRLKPAFREALTEEPELARLALGRKG